MTDADLPEIPVRPFTGDWTTPNPAVVDPKACLPKVGTGFGIKTRVETKT